MDFYFPPPAVSAFVEQNCVYAQEYPAPHVCNASALFLFQIYAYSGVFLKCIFKGSYGLFLEQHKKTVGATQIPHVGKEYMWKG